MKGVRIKMKLRKKLTATIITLIINWLIVWFASKGLALTPEVQAALIGLGVAISGMIVTGFNIGQGIADKGKEVGRVCLAFIMIQVLVLTPVLGTSWAMAQDVNSPPTTVEKLTECEANNADCDDTVAGIQTQLKACEKLCGNCTWKAIISDKKVQTTIISVTLAIVGGVVTLLATGGG